VAGGAFLFRFGMDFFGDAVHFVGGQAVFGPGVVGGDDRHGPERDHLPADNDADVRAAGRAFHPPAQLGPGLGDSENLHDDEIASLFRPVKRKQGRSLLAGVVLGGLVVWAPKRISLPSSHRLRLCPP